MFFHSYHSKRIRAVWSTMLLFGLCCGILYAPHLLTFFAGGSEVAMKKAEASYQFAPTGGGIVMGTAPAVRAATTAATEGVNVGDWKGAKADDNLHFGITSTASGYNAYLDIGNVELHGANKFIIETEFDLDATIPQTRVQICDWVSSTGVANAADAQCTGGGWRNLNLNDTAINTATYGRYSWHVYDGYWNSTATTKIATPLSNFVNGSQSIRVRYFSTTSSAASIVHIDYLRVFAVVNPVYAPAGVTQISGGTPLGDYSLAAMGGMGQTGSDNAYFRVPGTVGAPSDFYYTFANVKYFAGANTILFRAEHSCSGTNAGVTYLPKIFNFNSQVWDDLTSTPIACSTTDATNAWARSNISMGDYVSNGEVRVGWYATTNSTLEIRNDIAYIMIGAVTNGTSEITFGTNAGGSAASTQDLDMTGISSTWDIQSVDESNTFSTPIYAFDNDADATVEEASAANIDFSLRPPTNAALAGIYFAGRYRSGTAGTVNLGVADMASRTNTQGGWTQVGANGTTALLYSDNISVRAVTSGGSAGLYLNPEDFIMAETGRMKMRLRTSTSGATTNNSIAQWDFAMLSLSWIEDIEHRSGDSSYTPSGGGIVTGTGPAILAATAANTEGTNLGSWRATKADDNFHFGITSTASGYNAYIDFDDVYLNGANIMHIQTEFDLDATAPQTRVQICDWVSSTGVANAADAQCTGGGWRNVSPNDALITTTTPTAYHWQIYDGYWNSTVVAKISTPLTNFVDGNNTVRIRYYSTTSSAGSIVHIDHARIMPVVNPVYSASGATQITGGTPLGDYSLTAIGGAGQTGSDNAYFRVPGTAGAVSDFYLSFQNVKTYPGANAILVRAEYSCSTTGISHRPKIYNFNSSSWEDLTTASIACSTTDATNAWAKGNVTIANYISNGEIRIGWRGLANGTQEIRIDLAYVMIGTVNNGTSSITFGTNSAGTAANTQTLDMNGTASTWNIASVDESNTLGFAINANDNDNDATVEEATAANMDFTLRVPENAFPTGVFFAGRYMSGVAGTVNLGVADYRGKTSTQGGWVQVGANGTTALTYSDNITMVSVASGGAAGLWTNPRDLVNDTASTMNMRLRTSLSGATTNNSVAQWDFAMLSLQWIETPPPPSTLSFSISDNTIGFGTLTAAQMRFASGGGGGSTLQISAHTISAASNAPGGYVVTIDGETLTYGPYEISAAGATPIIPTAGIEQFGINAIKTFTTGSGSPLYPYSAGFAFDIGNLPSPILANYTNDNIEDTYDMYYLANISADTEAGEYAAVVTYTATATF